jgi:uncharacterized SAM-binding protein YcdF (DUF218 family)
MRLPASARRVVRLYFVAAGVLPTLFVLWLASPLPLFITAPLACNEGAAPAAAIVCLGAGVEEGLPSTAGWRRIRTSARLYRDGFAAVIIFSGGPAPGGRSIAEVYAAAAQLIGVPASVCQVEPRSRNTADHPREILQLDLVGSQGGLDAPLLVVTSPYHGRRAALCFRKAGFRRVRVITRYPESLAEAPPWSLRRLHYHVADRLYSFLAALEEWSAIGAYKARGWV